MYFFSFGVRIGNHPPIPDFEKQAEGTLKMLASTPQITNIDSDQPKYCPTPPFTVLHARHPVAVRRGLCEPLLPHVRICRYIDTVRRALSPRIALRPLYDSLRARTHSIQSSRVT